MDTQSRSIEAGGRRRSPEWVEATPESRASSSRTSVRVEDPLRAVGYMVLLLLSFAALFFYVVYELPGISAAGWRAHISPYHPANGPALSVNGGYERFADRASEEIKQLVGATGENQAYAKP